MAPKANSAMDNLTAEIVRMAAKMTAMMEKMDNMEKLLSATQAENTKLKDMVQTQADEILDLKDRLNDREQYARSWSIRCLNIPLLKEQENNPRYVMQQVFNELLLPILKGAVEKGDIPSAPSCCEIIEMAHILPGKKGEKRPVIVRFYSRYMRSLIFRHRRDFAPREEPPAVRTSQPASQPARAPRMRYSFFEDLTRGTYAKLTEIKNVPEVQSAWTVSGTIRFKVRDSETV